MKLEEDRFGLTHLLLAGSQQLNIETHHPILRRLVLSQGFDIFEQDPQRKVAVTREGFAVLGERIRSLGLPCLIVQEGGYHLESLEDNARAFFVNAEVWQL
ncbi:histone deacetylase-like protein [Pseudomonas sp. SJZ083]|nr:histone deacetylase-like protein [Pseudomonas sp. SJZ083]TWC45945.1 histone deacetylase-like protein [Pseudomonas sp. SJZ077]